MLATVKTDFSCLRWSFLDLASAFRLIVVDNFEVISKYDFRLVLLFFFQEQYL